MDPTDKLARKLIKAFEPLDEEVILEQLAVPENLADPEGSVDLWVEIAMKGAEAGAEASAGASREQEDHFVVRAKVSVPTAVVLECEVGDLVRLFRKELLHSEMLRRAGTSAGVASRAAERDGIPSFEQAERN